MIGIEMIASTTSDAKRCDVFANGLISNRELFTSKSYFTNLVMYPNTIYATNTLINAIQ